MARKPAQPKVGRPTKKKAPPPKKVGQTYHVIVSGRSLQGETESFDTEAKARTRGREAFEAMLPWCDAHNKAGKDPLNVAIGELNVTSFTGTRKTVCAMFDELTSSSVCVTVWQGALPKIQPQKGMF